MARKIQKLDDKCVVSLPPEVLAELGWKAGDMLAVEVVDGGIKLTRPISKHDEAMKIARRLMREYRTTLEALAKS
jgi:putative addiction module antidote